MTRSGLILLAALSLTARADIFTRLPSFLNPAGKFVEAVSLQRDAQGQAISVTGSDHGVYPINVVEAGRVTVTVPGEDKSFLTVTSNSRANGNSVHIYRVFKQIVDRNGTKSFVVGTDQENHLVPIDQTRGENVKFQNEGEVLARIKAEPATKFDFGWNTLRVMAQSRASSERSALTELLEAAQTSQGFAQTRTAVRWLPALQRVLKASPIADARLLRALELPKPSLRPALTTQELGRQIPAAAAE